MGSFLRLGNAVKKEGHFFQAPDSAKSFSRTALPVPLAERDARGYLV
jgi:hypothetical protein